MNPRPTQREIVLMERHPETAPIGWITGELQRHAHIGDPGHPGPVESLCGTTITRTSNPTLGAVYETCTVCWSASVWIRNRRAPATPHQKPEATRPRIQASGKGPDRGRTTNTR